MHRSSSAYCWQRFISTMHINYCNITTSKWWCHFRFLLLFLLLCQWLQQISRKANEGTYHYFSCSIAQSHVATGMEVVEDPHCINIFMRSIIFFNEHFLIVSCVLSIFVLLLKLHMPFCWHKRYCVFDIKRVTQPSLTYACRWAI
jgi:hypothetical protein